MNALVYKMSLGISILSLAACHNDIPVEVEEFSAGGQATVYQSGPSAYAQPAPNLTAENHELFLEGDAAFIQKFVTEPAELFGGIGPLYVQNSCIACHVRDGRSQVPFSPTDYSSGLLLRLSAPGTETTGAPLSLPGFGHQLQSRSIIGYSPEGNLNITYVDQVVEYPDGSSVTLQKPVYVVVNSYMPLPTDALISPRMASPVFGMGLLEAISESDILANADENDADGDGISGKANYVWDVTLQMSRLGRFGWKAAQPSLEQQAAEAFWQDMGMTSPYFRQEDCNGNCPTDTTIDLTDEYVQRAARYTKMLGVPGVRNLNDVQVQRGRSLFYDIGCTDCHNPKFNTGAYEIEELSNQTIYPYTDLLLHDMGEGLADGRPDFLATGSEWRTPPLWGIGLTHVVNSSAGFLHDGRARTLEEAILWHGGEADNSVEEFKNLSKNEREKLILFLESL